MKYFAKAFNWLSDVGVCCIGLSLIMGILWLVKEAVVEALQLVTNR